MLIYLQFVLLFQEKNRRLYWQLLVLSVLQAVVASAMNLGSVFGGLLVIYFLLAVFQMLMLCVQREAAPHEQETAPTYFQELETTFRSSPGDALKRSPPVNWTDFSLVLVRSSGPRTTPGHGGFFGALFLCFTPPRGGALERSTVTPVARHGVFIRSSAYRTRNVATE